jgi:drug/metabolite transporter (DMT)-like permease
MQIGIALFITLVSACALNVGYLVEHSVAAALPPLSVRHPRRSLRSLLSSRRWLAGFGIEAIGWLLYVAALALAPLSLVQAASAGGIGILALLVSRVTGIPLLPRERFGVIVAVVGLALLGVSIAGGHGEGSDGSYEAVGAWLGVSVVAAGLAVVFGVRLIGHGPAFGLATGIMFAAGDVATKTTVAGGPHFAFVAALLACYAAGTLLLQRGFQRGSALTTAGIATLFTNALPIVAGMTIFDEPLPDGWLGGVRIAAFAMVIVGAVAIARREAPRPKSAKTTDPDQDPMDGVGAARARAS